MLQRRTEIWDVDQVMHEDTLQVDENNKTISTWVRLHSWEGQ